MKKFSLDVDARAASLIVIVRETIDGDTSAIGSIFLMNDDEDLILYIQEMIQKFNAKYTEPSVQTTTGNPSTKSK